jgi:predicted TIM-barrel fold metal-dependent hydrolase
MIQPDWAKERNAADLDQVLSLIEEELEECVKNGCSGLKSVIGYYRTLNIENVGEDVAKKAFENLIKKKPVEYLHFPSSASPALAPVYEDPLDNKDLKLYQDFLLKRLLIRAGELGLCYLFHTGFERADGNPLQLSTILEHEEVRTKTKIILLHTGYPFHAQTAIMAYKHPNVYAEVSWLMGWPEIYRDILKTFLEITPSQKILYGSDATGVVERFGWCAWLFRKLLTEVLEQFIQKDGWSQEECLEVSKRILNENAKNILRV